MKTKAFLASLLLFAACRGERAVAPPSFPDAPVILISIDTLRADHLPLYGYRDVETPAIDALARDGVVFEHAWSHCPMTLPSHVSMLTGLLPTEHGVRNNLGFTYDAARHPPISRLLEQRGYASGAAVSSYVLRGETGLRNAFGWYEDSVDPRPGAAFADYQRSGATTAALASKWIDDHAAHPFFFFLHLYEPHVPYEPVEPFRSKFKSAYDGEIATADDIAGKFLAHLKSTGVYDRAMIVLTSDHGEGLGDHGEQQHSILLYSEAIRVPLIVKLPKSARKGTRIATPAALADIAPTIAAATDVKLDAPHAANLFALPESRNIYSETVYPYIQLGWSDLRSVVNAQFHYIDSSRPELYDVMKDPSERTNIVGSERRTASSLRSELDAYPRAVQAGKVSDEDAARLASLGYLGAVRSRPDPRTLPNPVDNIALLDEMQQAFSLANQHRDAEAVTALRGVLRKNPRLVDVWLKLAETYVDMGNANAAIDAYRQAIGVAGVFPPDVAAMLGNVYLQAGHVDEAQRAANAAMAGAPDKATSLLVRVALARRDYAEAERLARQMTMRGTSPSEFLLLAEVLKTKGDLAGAMNAVLAADQRAQSSGTPHVYGLEGMRGEILALSNRPAEAIRAYEEEVTDFPTNKLAYTRLAILYFMTGDHAATDRTLARLIAANPSPSARALAERTRAALQ